MYAQSVREYVQTGNVHLKQGHFDQSIIDYTHALDLNPNLAQVYNNRGVAYAHVGSFKRAIADFTMAIANNLNDAEAYNNRGNAYAAQGNLTQAVYDYTKAIAKDAFYEKAYKNRMLTFFKLEEFDKAWADVHLLESIGGTVSTGFLDALKKASGK